MKNVEIKAKVDDIDKVEKKSKELSDTPLKVIKQHDIFFNLPSVQTDLGGRLKMRQFEDESGELIYYQRPNVKGPKLSTYSKTLLNSEKFQEVKAVLSEANGILGEVKKIRHLYLVGQTRVHIDRVEGLGNFMELEVVLNDKDEVKTGEEIAHKLMKELGISESALISGAYLDMIVKKNKH